jgi:hypothetical protein
LKGLGYADKVQKAYRQDNSWSMTMTDETNQNDPPATPDPIEAEFAGPSHSPLTGSDAYNVVSDTVTGVNVRVKDNVFQAFAVFSCLLLGALIGALVVQERIPGALVGGFVGLVVGLLGSGTFLMVYRAVRHLGGRHD